MFIMKYRMMLWVSVMVWVVVSLSGCMPRRKIVMLTYNVQNLFDDQPNETKYADFQEMSSQLYAQKVSNLAGGIERIRRAHGRLQVVLLQEVEHEGVVHALIEQSPALLGMHVVFAKEPSMATGLAILTRYEVIHAMSVQVADPLGEQKSLRPLLVTVLKLDNGQPLVVINVHLASQRQERNRIRRSAALEQLYLTIESLRVQYGDDVAIVIGGDFNTNLLEPESLVSSILGVSSESEHLDSYGFYNPWVDYALEVEEKADAIVGTFAYQQQWQALDGMLIAQRLLQGNGLTFVQQAPVAVDYFLLRKTDDTGNEVMLPKAFYQNSIDGVSDHLPVVAIFTYHALH